MKKQDGLMMTIASDDEVEAEDDSETEAAAAAVTAAAEAAARPALTKAGKKRQRQKAVARVKKGIEVDPSFSFDVDVSLGLAERQAVRGWDFKSAIEKLSKEDPRRARTGQVLDNRIADRRSELRKGNKKTKAALEKKFQTSPDADAVAASESVQGEQAPKGEGGGLGVDTMDEDRNEGEEG
ncbi:unnamed protein product, partial [Laminaria digitata]